QDLMKSFSFKRIQPMWDGGADINVDRD
ncbi:hypothetical protein A2U01_0068750, partial [Trifolium medium]|nr:hypothetical protein [Trifolium medium]